MSSNDPRIRDAVQQAIRPSEADVIRARAVVLDLLASSQVAHTEPLVRAVLEDGGVDREPDREAHVHVGEIQRDPGATLDRDEPLLKRERLRTAAYEALAQLAADGILLPTDPSKSEVDVPTGVMGSGGGWRGGTRVTTDRPEVAGGYRISSRWVTSSAVSEVATLLDARDLLSLLGPRGSRCWEEAVAAFNRHLYLASAGMVGAASEAAWYSLGEAMADEHRLAKPLEDDVTVKVIQLVAERLKRAPRSTSSVNELQSQAAHLRDIRNYGLHPRSETDASLEAAFTETGCLVLLMEGRRYLARLMEIAGAAGVTLPAVST